MEGTHICTTGMFAATLTSRRCAWRFGLNAKPGQPLQRVSPGLNLHIEKRGLWGNVSQYEVGQICREEGLAPA